MMLIRIIMISVSISISAIATIRLVRVLDAVAEARHLRADLRVAQVQGGHGRASRLRGVWLKQVLDVKGRKFLGPQGIRRKGKTRRF